RGCRSVQCASARWALRQACDEPRCCEKCGRSAAGAGVAKSGCEMLAAISARSLQRRIALVLALTGIGRTHTVSHIPAARSARALVCRFRSSHQFAAHPRANFGIKGTRATSMFLVRLMNLKFLNEPAATDRNFKFAALAADGDRLCCR